MADSKILKTILAVLGVMLVVLGAWRLLDPVGFFTNSGLSLAAEFLGRIPETIQTDPERVRQILINLVGNVIKFTDHGSVKIISRFVPNDDDSRMQFDILDTSSLAGFEVDDVDLGKLTFEYLEIVAIRGGLTAANTFDSFSSRSIR